MVNLVPSKEKPFSLLEVPRWRPGFRISENPEPTLAKRHCIQDALRSLQDVWGTPELSANVGLAAWKV